MLYRRNQELTQAGRGEQHLAHAMKGWDQEMSVPRRKRAAKPLKVPPVPKKRRSKVSAAAWNFTALVDAVRNVHDECAAAASRTVNTALTLRNWCIGHDVSAYELNGADRANYGDRVVEALADALAKLGIPRCDKRELNRFRLFSKTYPQMMEAATPFFRGLGRPGTVGTDPRLFADVRHPIGETLSPQSGPERRGVAMTAGERLVAKGRAEGRVEGRVLEGAEILLRLLRARRFKVPADVRAQIEQCNDPRRLGRWIVRTVTARSAREVLAVRRRRLTTRATRR
jgi:hypothetical protein